MEPTLIHRQSARRPHPPKVARVQRSNPITRTEVIRARGRIHFKRGRGEQLIAQAWPARRGKKKTPLQQAWVDDFSRSARMSKVPDPDAMTTANCMAKGWPEPTGWFYRDVIESAMHGKLIVFTGNNSDQALSGFDESGRRLGQEVIPRVTTPTVFGSRVAAQAVAINTDVALIPSAVQWDNNRFWSATINPSRFTVRAPGLYLAGADVEFNAVTGGFRRSNFRVNGTSFDAPNSLPIANANTIRMPTITLLWFNAGDHVECIARTGTANVTATLLAFWLVAITPESLV